MKIIKDIVKKYKGEFDFNIIAHSEWKKAETKIKLRKYRVRKRILQILVHSEFKV